MNVSELVELLQAILAESGDMAVVVDSEYRYGEEPRVYVENGEAHIQ